jgi:hypothetical protein
MILKLIEIQQHGEDNVYVRYDSDPWFSLVFVKSHNISFSAVSAVLRLRNLNARRYEHIPW